VVLEFLGLSRDATLTGSEAAALLTGLERLLLAALPELERHFSPSVFPNTRAVLDSIRTAQAERRWPPEPLGAA